MSRVTIWRLARPRSWRKRRGTFSTPTSLDNGKYRVTAVNEDARTKIKIYDTATGKLVPLPQLPNADITGVNISRSEKLMAFYLNGDRSPSNLYVYDFANEEGDETDR